LPTITVRGRRAPVVEGEPDPHGSVPKVPGSSEGVGKPADVLLRSVVRGREHVGVEAHPGHDGETLVADAADVDAAPSALENHLDTGGDVVGKSQIGGQKVAGAGRQNRQGDVGSREGSDAGHYGAIATTHENEISTAPYRFRGLSRAGTLHRGLQPHRFRPSRGRQAAEDGPAQQIDVRHLDRVDDDGRP
jgi:hypothetical protein